MRRVFCSLCCFVAIVGYTKEPKYKNLKENSSLRDFAILRYLDKTELSHDDALEAFWELKLPKKEHLVQLKKLNAEELALLTCTSLSPKELLSASAECADLGFSLTKALTLSSQEQKELATKLEPFSLIKSESLLLLSEKSSSSLLQKSTDFIYNFWLALTPQARQWFDFLPTPEIIADKRFDKIIKTAFLEPSLVKLRSSIVRLSQAPTYESGFYLFLVALEQGDINLANEWLTKSLIMAKNERQRHRVWFWQWLVLGSSEAKNALLRSKTLSFYTLYLHEESEVVPLVEIEPLYGLSWNQIVPKSSIIQEWEDELKNEFENSPVAKYIQGSFRPFLASIARQESAFKNSVFSHAYAIGALQLIPIVIDEVAAKRKEKVNDYDDFFRPEKNVLYASEFIGALAKNWKHPLLTAYSYNGGSGYLKRQLERGLLSRTSQYPFEPFYSLEALSYEETREYGKKVITNFVLYSRIYHPECHITLHQLLETAYWPYPMLLKDEVQHSACRFGEK